MDWSNFPGSSVVERWVTQIRNLLQSGSFSEEHLRIIGLAALIEHEYPRNVEALAALIAQELGVRFDSVDPEHQSLPQGRANKRQHIGRVIFIQPGSWQENDDMGAAAPSLSVSGRVRALLAQNSRTPSMIILSACRDIGGIQAPLLRVSAFSRLFTLPNPSARDLGQIFIGMCDSSWFADDVRQNPTRIGHLLTAEFEGYEGRKKAKLFAERIFLSERRQVTLKDFIYLNSFGLVESANNPVPGEEFLERVAWHEAGHAALAMVDSCGTVIPELLTTVMRRDTYGFMTVCRQHCERRRFAYTQSMMTYDLRVVLAGRAAEEVFFGKSGVSDLSASDLESAADIVRLGILKYGFEFGRQKEDESIKIPDSFPSSFALVMSIPEWREIIEREYRYALGCITVNIDLLHSIKGLLLKEKVVMREDLENLWVAHKGGSSGAYVEAA